MKKIIISALSVIFTLSLTGSVLASYTYNYGNYGTYCTQDAYICPNGITVGRTGSNCQFVCPSTPSAPTTSVNSSYYYKDGCYTYYYNGTTNSTSIISNHCATNYNTAYNNYTANYGTYTYPSTNYYYTVPTSYYTNTSYTYPYASTYYYQDTYTYPSTYSNYNNSNYYYNVGYTDTGYNNYNYNYGNYGNGFMYTPTNPCITIAGYQVCY